MQARCQHHNTTAFHSMQYFGICQMSCSNESSLLPANQDFSSLSETAPSFCAVSDNPLITYAKSLPLKFSPASKHNSPNCCLFRGPCRSRPDDNRCLRTRPSRKLSLTPWNVAAMPKIIAYSDMRIPQIPTKEEPVLAS